jgi:hypothetical protein
LRLCDEPHDAGERGFLAGAGHFDAQRSGPVRGPRDHLLAGCFADRPRLARDHRLVDVARTVADHTVRRNTCTGPHQEDVSIPQL